MNGVNNQNIMLAGANIIPIAESHIEGFHKCLDIVARERIYLAFIKAPPVESTRAFVISNINNNVPQFVAIIMDKVIGWCDIIPNKLEGFEHCGELGMGVHPKYRGKGIGKELVKKTLHKAKEVGIERIELEVFESNIPAINLYQIFGFVKEGKKTRARKIDGKYDNVIEMALVY
jgi:RimJ/RimL family protein N-acetyltransferase